MGRLDKRAADSNAGGDAGQNEDEEAPNKTRGMAQWEENEELR
jgi:hypothetical protein